MTANVEGLLADADRNVRAYRVSTLDGCTLIAGDMPISHFAALALSDDEEGKGAVLCPDLARLAGATFAWGPKAAVAALTRKLAAPILADPNLTPLERWLRAGERGLSSDAIVGHLRGWPMVDQRPNRTPPEDPPYPHDPGDFRRCLLLLEQVPELRESFTLFMPSASPTWALLVSTWDQLTELFLSEAPADWRDPRSEGMAPKTRAALMRVVGLVGRVRP